MKTTTPGAGASFVCGILSIVLFWLPLAGLILGIVGIVKSNKARRIAASSPESYAGGGLAIAGLVCGIIGTVVSALWNLWILIVLIMAIPMLLWLSARPVPVRVSPPIPMERLEERAVPVERPIDDERVIDPAHRRSVSEEAEDLQIRPVAPIEAEPGERPMDSSDDLRVPPPDQDAPK
jgi:MFS family permease